MNAGFVGTRAEREWLRVMRRIADALERLADAAAAETEAPAGDAPEVDVERDEDARKEEESNE